MMEVVRTISQLQKQWTKQYSHAVLGNPTIGMVTSIAAGQKESPNVFPSLCTATFDIRTTPDLHVKAFALVQKALKSKGVVSTVYPPVPYGFTDPKSRIVNIVTSITKTSVGISRTSNDLCFFSSAGVAAVVFGPGIEETMHHIDEYASLKNINQCISIYCDVIEHFSSED